MSYPTPRTPSEFSVLAGRYFAAIANIFQEKTTAIRQYNGFTVAVFILSILTVFTWQMNWFRFQWRYHPTTAKAAKAENRAEAAAVIEGFEGLDGTYDPTTGQKFDGQKKNASNDGIIEMPLKPKMSFDLAPAAPEELRAQNVKAYIERFSKIAVAEMDKFGIPASVSMAQAIIESRSGTSVLAIRNNNHFGIKCFSKTCAKGHCTCYTDDHHKDFFRKYANPTDSWREHSQFLMKYRYRELLKYGKNYRVWAKGLRDFGYATDQNYDKKLIAIIERYELNKLDDL